MGKVQTTRYKKVLFNKKNNWIVCKLKVSIEVNIYSNTRILWHENKDQYYVKSTHDTERN